MTIAALLLVVAGGSFILYQGSHGIPKQKGPTETTNASQVILEVDNVSQLSQILPSQVKGISQSKSMNPQPAADRNSYEQYTYTQGAVSPQTNASD